jgi:transcriptional regulator with GAF, ATPase, and Fis domain
MNALENGQALVRAADERRRAARTAEIAERHEVRAEGEPFLRALHQRMAALHRQVQRQHLAAAALHAFRADAARAWTGQTHAALVTLVESLEIDGDGRSFVSGLTAQSVALLNVSAAAVLIADHEGSLGIASWSSEAARLFAAAELRTGGGPSIECHLTGSHRVYPTTSALDTRWPQLADTARAAHIAAVYAVPLRRSGVTFGVLTLLDRRDHQHSDTYQLVRLLTAAAGVALANQRMFDDHLRTISQLQSALTSRIAIEQAKGMLAERLGIPVDAAFDLLRGHARASNRNLHEVAAAIIDRGLHIVPRGSDRTAPLPRTTPRREP